MRTVLSLAQVVQFGRQLISALDGLVAVGHGFELVADLRELGPVDHQLAGEVHQLIEPVGIYSHGFRGACPEGGSPLVGFRERSLRRGTL